MKVRNIARVAILGVAVVAVSSALLVCAEKENPRTDEGNGWDAAEEWFVYRPAGDMVLPLRQPRGVAVDGDGRIYVSGDRRLLVYGTDGRREIDVDLSGPAGCLTVDASGRIFIAVGSHVEVYDRRGVKAAEWTDLGERALITSLAAGGEGIYVADAGNRIVMRFTAAGRLTHLIEAEDPSGFLLPSPYFDVAVPPEGRERVWVVNTGRHRLECYTTEGEKLAFWGRGSADAGGFAGCCNPVHIALLSDGRFATSEKGMTRVKIHDGEGRFVGFVAGLRQLSTRSANLDLAADGAGRIYVLDPAGRKLHVFQPAGEGAE